MTDVLPILSRTYALTMGGPGAVQELNWQLRDRITQTRDQLQADHPAHQVIARVVSVSHAVTDGHRASLIAAVDFHLNSQ
ncbi:hypothetical protein BK826_10275 [Rothia kristinae]|uniref:Uncharacterized protein n=1 Tax=Rothia kristinae TaxID=37923 RepID=A0A1S2MXG1_9MICC|nr:hypothetical protein [Rothia kristinae]OIJ34824.1 hypothetical protein BK826_10275 [Rothia kristinae]